MKYMLCHALQAAVQDFLVDTAGQDWPSDDLYGLDWFDFEVQSLGKAQFVIRAKEKTEDGKSANKPAHQIEVTLSGGG
jgi:hypothetical protein